MSVTSRKILFMSTTTAAENVPTPQSPEDIEALMEARVEARITAYEKNKEKAEELKNNGNEHFKNGDYEEAAKLYMEAYSLSFLEVNYLSNFAAALLKMKRYHDVETWATLGLHIQPTHLKARYRRLQARKARGLYQSALADAKALLRIDPSCPEAKKEIKELRSQLQLHEQYYDSEDELDDSPDENHDVPTFYPEDWSDSEDAQMTGNGIPCRHYNHLGCLRGAECKFSHAQDDFCVRDRLGKNVCIFYLVGNCKFGDDKCNYSHYRAALPPFGWWDNPEDVKQVAQELKLKGKAGVLRREIVNQRKSYWRVADKERNNPDPPQRSKPGKSSSSKGKKSGKKGKAKSKKKPFGGDFIELSDDEFVGMSCCGFSHEDVMELMSQGVKPWDSDAEDVLAVLNGDYY